MSRRFVHAACVAALLTGLLAPLSLDSARAQACGDAQILSLLSAVGVPGSQRHVEAADLNGDGLPDLVLSGSSSILIAMATGVSGGVVSYSPALSLPTLQGPTGTAIADFNGDGIKDIAVACDNAGVQLFTGVGSDGVGNGQFTQSFTLSVGSAWDVAAADINGDGILDLVVSLRASSILPLLGNGSGGVGDGSFRQGSPAFVSGYPKGLALGDLDGDGILDVAVATEFGNVGILKGGGSGGVGNGTFGPAFMLPCPGSTYDVTIADFDGDHYPDVASANYTGNSMSVFLGGPGLSFQAARTHAVTGSPLGIASADIDTDGHPDIVLAATGGGGSFHYFHNTGPTGANPDGFTIATLYGPSRIGYGISVADLNGDHSPDVLLPDVNDSFVEVAFNSCPAGSERTLTTNVVGQGSIVREPDSPTYPLETVVQLTAVPATGWTFANWSGGLLGSSNPASVTIHSDVAVTAVFIPVQRSLTVTKTGAGQGSVTRSPNRSTYDNGSTVRLTAIPAFGSVFASWSGDASGTANPLDLLMDGDKAVTVDFEIDPSLAPHILSVTDVPLDQGGKVKLRWSASSLETSTANPDTMITQYYIWREIPQSAFRAVSTGDASLYMRTATATREYFWEYVTALPASHFAGYSYTAATTNDSTALGNPYTSFLVQARNAAGTRWYDSDPDSGYSVDNLAPTTPGAITAFYGAASNSLHWGASVAPDLRGYRLHGGTSPDFVPGASNMIAEVTDTAFVDPARGPLYYRLAAVDVHGNLSPYVLVSPGTNVGVPAGGVAFALDGVAPNPSTGGHLTVQLSLPSSAPATLELLDASGRRLVSHRLEGSVGRQTVVLDPGRRLSPGLYWIRLRHEGQERSTRAVVMQ